VSNKTKVAAGDELAATGPTMLALALNYAGAGINVFPLDGKTPLTDRGFHDATTDREQVKTWWKKWPEAGIGTPDFDVVDVDLYKPACAETWKRIRPLIPEGTPHNKTGRGGLQFFFKPGTLKDGKIGAGVDNRYAGRNYVVLPPSRHPDTGKRYEALIDVRLQRPKPAPDFPHASGASSEFQHLRDQMDSGAKITDGRIKAAWWRAVEILRTLPPSTELEPVVALVQSWVNQNCAGDLGEVDVPKQVRGAARFVANEPANGGDRPRRVDDVERIVWEDLSAITMRPIIFVDKPLLQAAAFHLLTGRKGVGKGTLIADIAARVTRGELGEKRNVIWIGSEDSAAIDIKPRLVAAGGDPSRVVVVTRGWIQLPRDIDEIERVIVETGDVGLVVIDPVGNHITGKSSNLDSDVRDVLARFNELADTHDLVLIGVRHLTEKEAVKGVIAAILGASAWVHVPRAVLAVVRDDVDPSISHLQCVAGNRLPPDTPGRMFRIEGVVVPGLEEEVTRAVWLGDSTKDLEELLASTGKSATKTAKARELVLDILDTEGRQESDGLDARVARETGAAAQTIRNIRVGLGKEGLIRSTPEKDGTGAVERWIVSRTAAPRPVAAPDTESREPDTGSRRGPDTESRGVSRANAVTKPDTGTLSNTPITVSGLNKPDTETQIPNSDVRAREGSTPGVSRTCRTCGAGSVVYDGRCLNCNAAAGKVAENS
jgi:hypothetical protein